MVSGLQRLLVVLSWALQLPVLAIQSYGRFREGELVAGKLSSKLNLLHYNIELERLNV